MRHKQFRASITPAESFSCNLLPIAIGHAPPTLGLCEPSWPHYIAPQGLPIPKCPSVCNSNRKGKTLVTPYIGI